MAYAGGVADIRGWLQGGDPRSLGDSARAVLAVGQHPGLFGELMEAMFDSDPVVRMRAADAAEKASRGKPALLQPWKAALLGRLAEIEQKEVRWHVAQMLPRLRLAPAEREVALEILEGYLRAHGSLVKVFAMQALADFALQDPGLRERITPVIERLAANGTPAMRARGRRLMREFGGKA